MNISYDFDLMALLQVILASISIAVDIVLVFVAAKINNRADKNRVNRVLDKAAESTSQSNQPRNANVKVDRNKIEDKILRLLKKNKEITAAQFIKALKEFAETDTAQSLYACKDKGITWNGILSVDTPLLIDESKIEDVVDILIGVK